MASRHSRHESPSRPTTPSVSMSRPMSGYVRTNTLSPPPLSTTSFSPTATPGGYSQRLNVVTRVAIEGKAKQGQDGASIKMYLKIALPLESINPGSTIPLFPEENVKILTSQVHPLDSNTSVPYNFSSTVSPLLHNAGRALNLPARSNQTYQAAFGLSSMMSSRASGSRSTAEPVPVDVKYTGHIIVTGYHISYVVPKEFPVRTADSMIDGEGYSRGGARSRRPSVSEKSVMQFMAAIDMWIPFVARPPRSPFSLTIPTPRCLHNNIKLRIFPPNSSTSSSFASLSSAEDEMNTGSWDLTSEPHVTRSASKRLSKANSYTHFADDESSDSSSGNFSEGCGIQGTFPSAERIKVRWAKPIKSVGEADGRRRVGVRDVAGEMSCVILGKKDEGVLMNVDYKGTCSGIWFAGVATLLGMDVGLEAKGSDVAWASGFEHKWTVSGGAGYTGWDVGPPPSFPSSMTRNSSIDSSTSGPQIFVSAAAINGSSTRPGMSSSRQSSTSSLLRAPLPASTNEVSFEGSNANLNGSLESTMSSSMGSFSAPSSNATAPRLPGVPLTIHLNISELAAKNTFTFTVSGTIIVTPRPITPRPRKRYSSLDGGSDAADEVEDNFESIVLPRFTVLAAESESTTIIVRNDVGEGSANVEVFNPSVDIRDAKTRKTVLQRGATTRCGGDGGRIVLRSNSQRTSRNKNSSPGPSNTLSRVSSNSSLRQLLLSTTPSRSKRDGPLLIPYVNATVTPLILKDERKFPNAYAVRLILPVPIDTEDDEWLEFGLSQPPDTALGASILVDNEKSKTTNFDKPPKVELLCASVNGVPVRFETTATARSEDSVPFDQLSGREWVSWILVGVAGRSGTCIIDYVVSDHEESIVEDCPSLNVFLPTFALPVGRLEVTVDSATGLNISSLRSNLMHQQITYNNRKLIHLPVHEYFYPQLQITMEVDQNPTTSAPSYGRFTKGLQIIGWMLPTLLAIILLVWFVALGSELRVMRKLLVENTKSPCPHLDIAPPITVTATTTATFLAPPHTEAAGKRWFVDQKEAEPSPPSSLPAPSPIPEPTTTLAPILPTISWEPRATATTSNKSLQLPFDAQLFFPWLKFDFDFESVKPIVRVVSRNVVEKAKSLWFVLRMVYHFPLPPPEDT